MKEDTETLAELMLHAEQFCSKVEDAIEDVAPIAEQTELRLKIGQIRNQLACLQEAFRRWQTQHGKPESPCRVSSHRHSVTVGRVLCPYRDRFQNLSDACSN